MDEHGDEHVGGRRTSIYRGSRPKKPETVIKALDELITYTHKWLRRYEESWFDSEGVPATDLGCNKAGDLKQILEFCDYAIGEVTRLALAANEAVAGLGEVKKEAEKRLSQRRSNHHQGGE